MVENLKKFDLYEKIIMVLTALSIIATIFIYPNLPETIPYHWNINGSVKTAGKWIVFLTALLPVAIYYLGRSRLKKNQTDISMFVISLFLIIVHWSIIFIVKL